MRYLVIFLAALILTISVNTFASTMCPDGTYVSGSRCIMTPDGTFVGGRPQLAPDGTYVGGRPQMAPDGSYVGTKPTDEYGSPAPIRLCPDGTYVSGERCKLMPNDQYIGE